MKQSDKIYEAICKPYLKENFISSKELAKFMHNKYEEIAKQQNWQTQRKCRVSFDNLPEKNKQTMILVAEEIIKLFKRGKNG